MEEARPGVGLGRGGREPLGGSGRKEGRQAGVFSPAGSRCAPQHSTGRLRGFPVCRAAESLGVAELRPVAGRVRRSLPFMGRLSPAASLLDASQRRAARRKPSWLRCPAPRLSGAQRCFWPGSSPLRLGKLLCPASTPNPHPLRRRLSARHSPPWSKGKGKHFLSSAGACVMVPRFPARPGASSCQQGMCVCVWGGASPISIWPRGLPGRSSFSPSAFGHGLFQIARPPRDVCLEQGLMDV